MCVNNHFAELSRRAVAGGKSRGVPFASGNNLNLPPLIILFLAISNGILASWLRDFRDDAEKARILEIGERVEGRSRPLLSGEFRVGISPAGNRRTRCEPSTPARNWCPWT